MKPTTLFLGLFLSLATCWLMFWLLGETGIVLLTALALALCATFLILKRPTLGLFLILFSLPFERIPSIDIGGVSLKANLFFGAVTIASTLLALATKQLRLRWLGIHWLIAAFLLVATMSATQAVEVSRAVQILAFTIFTCGFAWIVPQLLVDGKQLRTALLVLLGSAAVVGVFGLYQFSGDLVGLPNALTGLDPGFAKAVFGFPRIQAFSLEPLYLGNYLLLPLSLLLALILSSRWLVPRSLTWGLFALLSVVLVLTVSRGAYIAAVVSVSVIVLSLIRQALQPRHLLLAILFVVGIGGASVGFLAYSNPKALETFREHVLLEDFVGSESGEGRINSFALAYGVWRQQPWLGVGPGNFGAAIFGNPDPRVVEHIPIVNNQYLELLAETGLAGLLAMALFLGALFARSVVALLQARDQLVRAALIGVTAALIGMLVQYNFFSTLYIIHIWTTVGLLIAIQTIALQPKPTNRVAV